MNCLQEQHSRCNSGSGGFTLVELAIVLVIFALLAGGLVVTLSAQQDIQRLAETRRQMADIREALLGYAVSNGRLPPPADPTKATSTAGAGLIDEGRVTGVLPWATLGLPETDPWGRRYTYRVRTEFADLPLGATIPTCTPTPLPALATFALCSAGNITVSDGLVDIATNLPAIVVSHGKNGLGAYLQDGTPISGASGEELENANNDTKFIAHAQTTSFDDEVVWIPLPILMNRMIAAGRLP